MAAATKKHITRKETKNHKNSFFCFFGGCFGISNKVSAAEHGGGKSAKIATSSSGRTLPINHQKIPATSSSTKEIHVVEEDEVKTSQNLALPAHELGNTNKTQYENSKKYKNRDESNEMTNSTKRVKKQNGIPQETWTNPTKLSQSVSLPPLCQRREKPGAAADEGKKGRAGGEFDPKVGAVIIMVTLIVMLIWGKVCAVVSTAAWLYFIPRLRANMELRKDHVDLDSWEYKKMVVLQGLLRRNQHQ